MTAQTAATLAPHWRFANDPGVLGDIGEPEVNLCVWQRSLASALQQAVSAVLREQPRLRVQQSGTEDSLRSSLQARLGEAGQPLTDDVCQLVDMVGFLFDHPTWGVRLTALDRAMCPRYHVDQVTARLITTYQGPGMQWLLNDAISRRSRPEGGLDLPPDDRLDHQQLNAGDVALCKGDGWAGAAGHGLIHRSPEPPEGQTRLLLTLDPC